MHSQNNSIALQCYYIVELREVLYAGLNRPWLFSASDKFRHGAEREGMLDLRISPLLSNQSRELERVPELRTTIVNRVTKQIYGGRVLTAFQSLSQAKRAYANISSTKHRNSMMAGVTRCLPFSMLWKISGVGLGGSLEDFSQSLCDNAELIDRTSDRVLQIDVMAFYRFRGNGDFPKFLTTLVEAVA